MPIAPLDPLWLSALIFLLGLAIGATSGAAAAAPLSRGLALPVACGLAGLLSAIPVILWSPALAGLPPLPLTGPDMALFTAVISGLAIFSALLGAPIPIALTFIAGAVGAAFAGGVMVDIAPVDPMESMIRAGTTLALATAGAVPIALMGLTTWKRAVSTDRPREALRRALPPAAALAVGLATALAIFVAIPARPIGPIVAVVVGVFAAVAAGFMTSSGISRRPFFTPNDRAGADAAYGRIAATTGIGLAVTIAGAEAVAVCAVLLPLAGSSRVDAIGSLAAPLALGLVFGAALLGGRGTSALRKAMPDTGRAAAAGTGALAGSVIALGLIGQASAVIALTVGAVVAGRPRLPVIRLILAAIVACGAAAGTGYWLSSESSSSLSSPTTADSMPRNRAADQS